MTKTNDCHITNCLIFIKNKTQCSFPGSQRVPIEIVIGSNWTMAVQDASSQLPKWQYLVLNVYDHLGNGILKVIDFKGSLSS